MGIVRQCIRFLRDDTPVQLERLDPGRTLLDYLRTGERAVGTKEGCAEGDCGACTVVLGRLQHGRVRYEAVNACIFLLAQADGAQLLTIENLAGRGTLHPVQREMVDRHGSQCGFCTPGIVMSLFALYHQAVRPVGRQPVLDALAGNLCRCTGYRPIVDAALAACAQGPQDRFASSSNETARRLAALDNGDDIFVGDASRFFAAPASEHGLADLYGQHPDATLVAGCTDVGLRITKDLAQLDKIIWLGRVAELKPIEWQAGELIIGAAASLADAHAALAQIDADLGELVRRFGSPQIRSAGTVGGNIANGSPIGDLAPAMIALDARIELRRLGDVRSIPLEAFFLDYRKQDRRDREFVRRIIVPELGSADQFRCFKVSKRFDEDISAVLGAFRVTLTGRRITSARIAFGGMASIPKRATRTEQALQESSLDEPSSWGAAIAAIGDDFRPISDLRASADYRLLAARNLLRKALLEIASGGTVATRLAGDRGGVAERVSP